MKRALLLLVLATSAIIQAQELPSVPANGFAFPIGSTFSIKLIPVDSVNYDFSVISFEPFEEVVDTWNHDDLFIDKGEDNTILFYFCLGTHGKTKKEKKRNMKVLLLMKNYSNFNLHYTSEIQRKGDGEFETTSNVGMYAGAKGTEMWPYMIYAIGLREFRKITK